MINEYNQPEQTNLVLDEQGKYYMLETSRWGKFLGILWAIVLGLLSVLFPVILQTSMVAQGLSTGSTAVAGAGIVYFIIIIGINFYPLYCQLKFSHLSKKAIKNLDQALFTRALKFQKGLYKYIGILTIIMLFFYGIIAFFWLAVGVTASV